VSFKISRSSLFKRASLTHTRTQVRDVCSGVLSQIPSSSIYSSSIHSYRSRLLQSCRTMERSCCDVNWLVRNETWFELILTVSLFEFRRSRIGCTLCRNFERRDGIPSCMRALLCCLRWSIGTLACMYDSFHSMLTSLT